MRKNVFHQLWLPVVVTAISTMGIFVLAEYVFHIPSNILNTQDADTPLDATWTPRPPVTVVPTPIVNTGTVENDKIACTMEYAPVCGADSRDYSNECMAIAGGTTVAHTGNCIKEKEVVATGSTMQPTEIVSGERDISLFNTGTYQIYENKTFGYKLALPKYAYYQGYGKSSNTYGADHVLAISLSGTGAESLDTAEVKVLVSKGVITEITEGTSMELPNGVHVYIIALESSSKIQKIVDTVTESIQ